MSRDQDTSVPHPKGDTMPVPVITTRLIALSPPSSHTPCVGNLKSGLPGRKRADSRSPPYNDVKRLRLSLFDELDSVANRENGVCSIVRDFNAEFFFECHDQFDGV